MMSLLAMMNLLAAAAAAAAPAIRGEVGVEHGEGVQRGTLFGVQREGHTPRELAPPPLTESFEYTEATDGQLSSDPLAPTSITLIAEGRNVISNTFGASGSSDGEFLNFV